MLKCSHPLSDWSKTAREGLIVVVHGAAACTPEASELIRAGAVTQAKSSGRACAAYVIRPGMPGYRIMNTLWRSIYAGVQPVEIFDTLEAATRWSHMTLSAAEVIGDNGDVLS